MKYRELVDQAIQALTNAYAPYSKFKVGAALLAASGRVYLGCNIENAAYSPTNCAERTAIFKAVSEGERKFKALAVAADTDEVITPCGVCRQVLAEFFDDEVVILLANLNGQVVQTKLSELLPGAFTGEKYGI
ncbi:MAG: cytidine deaminase [Candidatus Wallacebacter cryptica]|nr:cytidine deaminase [Bacillota bacterium]